jgi:serine/threonine protein kinase
MEYFPCGTLDKHIDNKLKERDARVISSQILEGLNIMHEEGFTHRDLKPQVTFTVNSPNRIHSHLYNVFGGACSQQTDLLADRISSLFKTHQLGG